MKCLLMLLLAGICVLKSYGQNILKAMVEDGNSGAPVVGALVIIQHSKARAITDVNGLAILHSIPDGQQSLVIKFLGYDSLYQKILFPRSDTAKMIFQLYPSEDELSQITVSSTRGNRTIADEPTRVEFISGEELGEKNNMSPGNIRMLLSESTGIQTQQTSPVSGNSEIRIQGLDGRYTLLMKDGLPLYSGLSGGLSIMQIPPVDLKQVEIIKGSSSTLYGGGAIAGMINLISKVPEDKPELDLMLNETSAGGSDINSFYSQKYGKTGLTLYAAGNFQNPYDVNKDGFSDIPKFERYTLAPRFFYYINNTTTLSVGLNGSTETRTGGDMQRISGLTDSNHVFYEEDKSNRISSQLIFEKNFNKGKLVLKNSLSYFGRKISMPDYAFEGNQYAGFSEISYLKTMRNVEWIGGIDYTTDQFREVNPQTVARNYNFTTVSAFLQNTWTASKLFSMQSALRTDFTNRFGAFILPRISGLFKINSHFTSRIGGGLGYKEPAIFLNKSEEVAFRNVKPLDMNHIRAEKSEGANGDINYKTFLWEKITFSINQLFFITRISNPLVFNSDSLLKNTYFIENSNGALVSRGFETNMKLGYQNWHLYFGYTFVNAQLITKTNRTYLPLTPESRTGTVLMYEKERKGRIGYEVYYTGVQRLTNGDKTPGYWIMGIMAEKYFKKFSLFINFENFLDTRQSRYGPMYTGSRINPDFNELWAPTDGFIVNGGIKLNFLQKE